MEAALKELSTLAAASPDLVNDTRIHSVHSVILDVPTQRRHRLSNTSVDRQSFVHVAVRLNNGVVGNGEASTLGGPRWSEESVEAIKANIDTYLAPCLIGQPASGIEAANLRMDQAAKRNAAAKSALNSALLDALGLTLNVPVATLLGGPVRDRFPVIWTLASGNAGQEAEEAQSKIEAGTFNRFKIKLGFANPADDIERLAILRRSLPGETLLVADVNQAWDEATCLRWFPALEDLDIGLIEQPLPAGRVEGMARLAARTRIPLMLDEAVFSADEALRATTLGAGSVLSLKLCKHGSAQALQRIAAIADAGGLLLYGGCLLESSLGAAAHLAVFSTLPRLQWGTEHFGPRIVVHDTTLKGLEYQDYEVLLPTDPGLGVTPDPAIVDAYKRTD